MDGNNKNNMVDVIYDYLMQQILSQKMESGDRIPEAKIASEWQMMVSLPSIQNGMQK